MSQEIEDFIDHVAANVAQQQELQFSSQQEARRYLEKTKLEIRHSLKEGNEVLMQGLNFIKEKNHGHVHGYTSAMADKLLKHLNSSKKLAQIIETEIMNNERALLFFSEMVGGFYDCGDFYQEECVISVFMALFPLNPQPYVFYGTMLWRRDGIDAAENFYDKILKVIQEPGLAYFAADCFYKNGQKKKAKDLLEQTLNCAQMSLEKYNDVKQQMLTLLGQC
jgi:tetratricopeptide (TPR) repeat protein